MSEFNNEAYLGEIRMFGGNYAPVNWAFCDGQLLNIMDYHALYTLIGKTYGGDGLTTFALPDMKGRVPVHMGQGSGLSRYNLGDQKGEESVILTVDELPKHSHGLNVDTTGAENANPENHIIGNTDFNLYFRKPSSEKMVVMADKSLSEIGQSKPHHNIQPTLCINFIICIVEVQSQDVEANPDEAAPMSQFIGEIRVFPYNFIPKGWMSCNGSYLRVGDFPTLYSIIGNYYGGGGVTDFRLPNMVDRIPMHKKSMHQLGFSDGEDTVQINMDQMPTHTHALMAIDELADSRLCDTDYMLARANIPDSRNLKAFCKQNSEPVNLDEKRTITHVGGSKPHTNIQPSISLQYCIAYEGRYPAHT